MGIEAFSGTDGRAALLPLAPLVLNREKCGLVSHRIKLMVWGCAPALMMDIQMASAI